MDRPAIVASLIALYLVPILELTVNIPLVEAILMLLVSLIIFPYAGCIGRYSSTFAIQLFICGLTLVEAMRIYSFMPTTISSAVLMVALTGYLAKKVSVWLLSIMSTARRSTFKSVWASLVSCCAIKKDSEGVKSNHIFAKGIINLYLLSASQMVIIGMATVGFFMICSVGLFRSTIVLDPTHHMRMAASIHGALHSVNTLCDLQVAGDITAAELKMAVDSIRDKLYDHSFLIIEKLTCSSGEWEWDGDVQSTQGFSRENRRVELEDTKAWVKGISNEKYETYVFHIVASLVCLFFFVTFMLLGANSIQKSIGKGVSDTLFHLSRYDNTTQLFNTSAAPPFYSVLHDDHHHHKESWWDCFTRNALWHAGNILKHQDHEDSKHRLCLKCCTKKQKKNSVLPGEEVAAPRIAVESLDLEVAADHLIHLYQMKRDHHDVRRNGNIDRGQFVEASVSDWISSVFKQPGLSVATTEPSSPPPAKAATTTVGGAVKRNTQMASKLPPIQSPKLGEETSDSFDGNVRSVDHWKVDGTKLDELLERIRSRDLAIARNAELQRRRKRIRQTHDYEVAGSFYSGGSGGAADSAAIEHERRRSGGTMFRDRRVHSAPEIKSIPLHHFVRDRISAAGHWPMSPHVANEQKKDALLAAERNKLLRAETEQEGELLKLTSVDFDKVPNCTINSFQSKEHDISEGEMVSFENGWEDTFGGDRIGKSNLVHIDIPTPYHISLDSVKLDVLQLNMPQLKALVTEVLKSSAPLPAPAPPPVASKPQHKKIRRSSGRGFSQGGSFKRRVAAVVCKETLSPKVIADFVSRVLDGYDNNNPYHNSAHGADVCHTVWRFQRLLGAHYLFTPVEIFAQLVAALGHDLGHPGLNNNYLVSNFHPLAMSYHDESPLENMHCYELFRIIHSFGGECDVFGGLGRHGRAESREIVVKCILSTDMAFHSSQVTKLGELVNKVSGPMYAAVLGDLPRHSRFGPTPHPALEFLDDVETRRSVLEVLVHTADINNPLKPRNMAIAWTTRVVEEFHQQGDRERSENVPISPMCDRSRIDLPSMQLGFMDFVVAPLVSKVVALFPSLVPHAFYLFGNYSRFYRLKEADLLKAAEAEALENGPLSPSSMHRQSSDVGAHRSSVFHEKPVVPSLPPAVENLRNKRKDLGLGFFNYAYPPHTPIPKPPRHSALIIKSEIVASTIIGQAKELKRSNSWSPGPRDKRQQAAVGGEGGLTAVQTKTRKMTKLLRILITLGGGRRDSEETAQTR